MDAQVLLIILFMALVTYLPRMLPLILVSRRSLPEPLVQWLRFVPVTVLASLLGPSLLAREETLALSLQNYYLLAAVPAVLVAYRTKQMLPTVLTGMITVALLRYFNL